VAGTEIVFLIAETTGHKPDRCFIGQIVIHAEFEIDRWIGKMYFGGLGENGIYYPVRTRIQIGTADIQVLEAFPPGISSVEEKISLSITVVQIKAAAWFGIDALGMR